MTYVPPDPRYQYREITLGLAVHGTMGGSYEKLASDPRAKNPYHWHRTTAEYIYEFVNGGQQKKVWPPGDPTGSHIPATFKNQFAARVSAWHDLTPAEKEVYNIQGLELGYVSGFHFWMSLIVYV